MYHTFFFKPRTISNLNLEICSIVFDQSILSMAGEVSAHVCGSPLHASLCVTQKRFLSIVCTSCMFRCAAARLLSAAIGFADLGQFALEFCGDVRKDGNAMYVAAPICRRMVHISVMAVL